MTATDITVQSTRAAVMASPRALELHLRQSIGLTRREAKRLVAGGYVAMVRGADDGLAGVHERLDKLFSSLTTEA